MADPTRTVLFVTTGLDAGGAEVALLRLLDRLRAGPVAPALASLRSALELNIPFLELGMESGAGRKAAGPFRLAGFARSTGAEVLQGWMYHGNIAASFSSLMVSGSQVSWSVRQSLGALATEKGSTVRLIRRAMSVRRRPATIVYNSETAARDHEQLGYPADRSRIIPNGFDLEKFQPDSQAGDRLRAELQIPASSLLVGMIARYHAVKDHESFFAAAARLGAARGNVHFILAGEGVAPDNQELANLIAVHGLADRCHLLGRRDDLPALNAALDLATLTSLSEGFPNVLGEALACGVPCVATDVGDSGVLLKEAGEVVPCGDPQALVAAWERFLAMTPEQRRKVGAKGRATIRSRYSLDRMVTAFEDLYMTMVQRL